jgi:hypothetical protein
VILVLRFIGILNAAIWLGAAVFFFFAQQTFFSGEIKNTGLHPFWPGVMAQLFVARFFHLHCLCGAVALAHLLAEWVYLGRALHRFTLGLLLGLFLVGLLGGLWLQPMMKDLFLAKYSMGADYKPVSLPVEQRLQATRSFSRWHGISMGVHVVAVGGLLFYLWRVTHPPDNLRFVGAPKIRG